jgi:hypothetical protein
VARCVLARYGADIADAARPEHSASNEVWLAEQVVIRVSRAHDGSLRREAELATILPAEVGYPVVLEVGHNAHVEWMVTERLPGTNIEESWPDLDGTTRSNAIVDLWTRLLAVHQTDAGRARSIGSDSASTPFYALDESEASAMLAWLASEGAIEPDLRDVLADMLDQMFRAIPLVPLACHTLMPDPTTPCGRGETRFRSTSSSPPSPRQTSTWKACFVRWPACRGRMSPTDW